FRSAAKTLRHRPSTQNSANPLRRKTLSVTGGAATLLDLGPGSAFIARTAVECAEETAPAARGERLMSAQVSGQEDIVIVGAARTAVG
ncbi:hypothetical protein, partial [Escherichia coli]|uniref:hypothetical protein n=1 Tax=Escherichia coli TaxID=562 RepID=UPI001952D299